MIKIQKCWPHLSAVPVSSVLGRKVTKETPYKHEKNRGAEAQMSGCCGRRGWRGSGGGEGRRGEQSLEAAKRTGPCGAEDPGPWTWRRSFSQLGPGFSRRGVQTRGGRSRQKVNTDICSSEGVPSVHQPHDPGERRAPGPRGGPRGETSSDVTVYPDRGCLPCAHGVSI